MLPPLCGCWGGPWGEAKHGHQGWVGLVGAPVGSANTTGAAPPAAATPVPSPGIPLGPQAGYDPGVGPPPTPDIPLALEAGPRLNPFPQGPWLAAVPFWHPRSWHRAGGIAPGAAAGTSGLRIPRRKKRAEKPQIPLPVLLPLTRDEASALSCFRRCPNPQGKNIVGMPGGGGRSAHPNSPQILPLPCPIPPRAPRGKAPWLN